MNEVMVPFIGFTHNFQRISDVDVVAEYLVI